MRLIISEKGEKVKVYLASSFELVKTLKNVARILENHGYAITVKWWVRDYKKIDLPDEEWYTRDDVKAISERNFKGIRKADILILVAGNDKARKFNGANIELGYALALRKPCYSMGKLERSAMYVPVLKHVDLAGILETIQNSPSFCG